MLDFQYLYSMKIKLSEEQLKRLVKSTLGEQNVTNKKEGGFWVTIKDMLSENRPIQSDIEEEYPTTWNVEEFARLK